MCLWNVCAMSGCIERRHLSRMGRGVIEQGIFESKWLRLTFDFPEAWEKGSATTMVASSCLEREEGYLSHGNWFAGVEVGSFVKPHSVPTHSHLNVWKSRGLGGGGERKKREGKRCCCKEGNERHFHKKAKVNECVWGHNLIAARMKDPFGNPTHERGFLTHASTSPEPYL